MSSVFQNFPVFMLRKRPEHISEVHKSSSVTQIVWCIEVTHYSAENIGCLPWVNSGSCLGRKYSWVHKINGFNKKIQIRDLANIYNYLQKSTRLLKFSINFQPLPGDVAVLDLSSHT